jgi:NADH-quinone oxidoreductase subunit H
MMILQSVPIAAPAFSLLEWIQSRLGLSAGPGWTLVWGVILCAVVFLPAVSLVAMFSIWWERKVAGHMQARFGPNRVGPIGLLQSIADGVKLILKEDLVPASADQVLFRLAPYLVFAPTFAVFLALPFGPSFTFEPRLNVGLFWVLSILSVEVMGVILAGWASNNKWSVYGAMREACQMVSYEIPLGISILIAVMAAGTLNLSELGHLQSGGIHTWLIFQNPFVFVAFFVFFVASLASNKRAPFDLPESESELVAGYHTEYSGLRFSFFFFAEYAAMFVVGGLLTAVFLGGWNDPFGLIGYYDLHLNAAYASDPSARNAGMIVVLNCIATGIFVGKVLCVMFAQMWLRWTLPRPRIDQVLYICVKVLLPLSMVLLLGAAIWQLVVGDHVTATHGTLPWVDYQPWDFAAWAKHGLGSLITQVVLAVIGLTAFGVINLYILYAAVTGRGHQQRLTEPSPIDEGTENLMKV